MDDTRDDADGALRRSEPPPPRRWIHRLSIYAFAAFGAITLVAMSSAVLAADGDWLPLYIVGLAACLQLGWDIVHDIRDSR